MAGFCFAQKPNSGQEEQELQQSLAEAGSSPVEFSRALEAHLTKYPNTPHKMEIERALVKAAVENKDDRRLILYGERVLVEDPDDFGILERVSRALLSTENTDEAQRALKYARHYEQLISEVSNDKPAGGREAVQWREDRDQRLARALVLEARATGNLGKTDDAIALARKSFAILPTAEAARETAKWFTKAGKDLDAVRWYADAFVVPDSRYTDATRAQDRVEMGRLYRRAKGNETGLGDLILEAYDRTSALVAQRRLELRQIDPNMQATNPIDFTLTGVKGEKLSLRSLQGKVVVMDFWATWCGPCRAQHPLYEQVKKRFDGNAKVVFLSVNTDEEHTGVEAFLQANHWDKTVYFEEGMSAALRVSSIPTTIILDPRGDVFSRMNGYIPERFVDMLSERIGQALKVGVTGSGKAE